MNLCILIGKIVNEIDLKFIFDSNKKTLAKEKTSIVKVLIELNNKQMVMLKAYDEMADYIYRKVKKEDNILIQGKLRKSYVEIEYCEILAK